MHSFHENTQADRQDHAAANTSSGGTASLPAVPVIQRQQVPPANATGMPDSLKNGLETMSGADLSDVRVHYNSGKPAQFNALAYAQGNEIHLGPGQEKHLPHEGWHAVQQQQGRVAPNMHVNGTPINNDSGLEAEADKMGAKALQFRAATFSAASSGKAQSGLPRFNTSAAIQRVVPGFEDLHRAEDVPDSWVDTYIRDITHSFSHLYDEDLVLYLNTNHAGWQHGVAFENAGNHWNLTFSFPDKPQIQVRTRADGNCGAYAIHAIVNRAALGGNTDNYWAPDLFVAGVRVWIQIHAIDRNEIKKRIFQEIRDSESIVLTGFGPALSGVLLPLEMEKRLPAKGELKEETLASSGRPPADTVADHIRAIIVRLGILSDKALDAIDTHPAKATAISAADIILSFCIEFEGELAGLKALSDKSVIADNVFHPETWSSCYSTADKLFRLLGVRSREAYDHYSIEQAAYALSEVGANRHDADTREAVMKKTMQALRADMAGAKSPRIYNCGYGIHGFAFILRNGYVELLQSFANGLNYHLPAITVAESIKLNKKFGRDEMLSVLELMVGNPDQRANAQQHLFATGIETATHPFPLCAFYWEANNLKDDSMLQLSVIHRVSRNIRIMNTLASLANGRLARIKDVKAILGALK